MAGSPTTSASAATARVRQHGEPLKLTDRLEKSSKGAYRFCRLDLPEIKNTFLSFEDLFGPTVNALEERIAETQMVDQKVALMQQFLVRQLCMQERASPLLDYSVEALTKSHGMLPIGELEQQTGYTRRYLDRLFQSMVGLPPKRLAAVLRFHHFYSAWAQSGALDFYREELHGFYYDQAHFIREFRRFSGMAPRSFASRGNEFGRIFHHSQDEHERATGA